MFVGCEWVSTVGNREPSGAKRTGVSAAAGADVRSHTSTAVKTLLFTVRDLTQHALPARGAVAGVGSNTLPAVQTLLQTAGFITSLSSPT